MNRVKFSEVPAGEQFKYAGRLFRKLGMNLAKEKGGTRTVFPSSAEVELFGGPASEPPRKRPGRIRPAAE